MVSSHVNMELLIWPQWPYIMSGHRGLAGQGVWAGVVEGGGMAQMAEILGPALGPCWVLGPEMGLTGSGAFVYVDGYGSM